MGLQDWAQRTSSQVKNNGWKGVTEAGYELYSGLWRTLGWHVPRGTNIYEHDWDALIILDACRVDLMRDVADDYDFLGPVESFESVGSMSQEWMAKTFTDEYADEMAETAYVTANVFSDSELDSRDFLELDELWKYAWDDDHGVVPPRPVTDRAIHHGRENDPERLIVHYMQPHHPFIADDGITDDFASDPFGREGRETVIDALRRGEISRDEFWKAYRANLELVLEDVELLLSNLDAEKVVITADHGDALGEWGLYDHPAGCLHPVVKDVPWSGSSGSDTNEYEPKVEHSGDSTGAVEDRLSQLGYIN